MTLSTLERDTARENLNQDERMAVNAEISEILDELATEIAKIRRLADEVPTDYASSFTALALVGKLGRISKPRAATARIVHLLDQVQTAAIRQARAHEATLEQIGAETGETRQNVHDRMKRNTN